MAEHTDHIPKPMVEIGGRPILWHIMKTYSHFGFNDFVVALGYKGEVVKDYFVNFWYRSNSLTVSTRNKNIEVHDENGEDWKVSLLDTGLNTMTGGRVKRVAEFLPSEPFMLAYGDGVADVDINRLLEFHKSHGRLATVTAVRPPARYGGVSITGDLVSQFAEKPEIGEGWINGGFFILEPGIADYIEGDETIWERGPLERLTADGQLAAYLHDGFWQSMDTLREVRLLESMWANDEAPWRVWDK